jgi:hypothetical protein
MGPGGVQTLHEEVRPRLSLLEKFLIEGENPTNLLLNVEESDFLAQAPCLEDVW